MLYFSFENEISNLKKLLLNMTDLVCFACFFLLSKDSKYLICKTGKVYI